MEKVGKQQIPDKEENDSWKCCQLKKNYRKILIREEASSSVEAPTAQRLSRHTSSWGEVRTVGTRVFVEDGEGIRTQAFDESKLTDPSLIIYAPVRVLGNKTIVTNGDQTDTIYEGMDRQMTFEQALRSREFEPDAPNYTPRISGIMHVEGRKKLQLRHVHPEEQKR